MLAEVPGGRADVSQEVGRWGADLFTSELRPLPTQDTQTYRLTKGQKPGRSGYSCSPPTQQVEGKASRVGRKTPHWAPNSPKKVKAESFQKNRVFQKTAGKHYANVKLMRRWGSRPGINQTLNHISRRIIAKLLLTCSTQFCSRYGPE